MTSQKKQTTGRGGRREGAGRRKGSGQYGEDTKPIQLPLSFYPVIEGKLKAYVNYRSTSINNSKKTSNCLSFLDWFLRNLQEVKLQQFSKSSKIIDFEEPKKYKKYSNAVAATPNKTSFSDDFEVVTLNEILVDKSKDIYFLPVTGDSMIDAGINHDSLLVVEPVPNSFEPRNGDIVVVASSMGSQMVKIFQQQDKKVILISANKEKKEEYTPIELDEENQEIFFIQGVVRKIIGNPPRIDTSQYLSSE